MNPKPETEITVRDEIIAGLDKENKMQNKLIREFTGMGNDPLQERTSS